MDIGEFLQDGVQVLEPKGRIDSATSRAFGELLLASIDAGKNAVLVDLSHIAYVSSAGFRSLLIAAKRAKESGRNFAICGLNAEVRRLFQIGAFVDLFRIFASRQDGIADMK